MYDEPSGVDLPMEDPDEANNIFESLGGRSGYSQRVNEFDRQAQTMRHEKRYLDKVKTDKLSQRQDERMRNRKNHDIEFDDYRKSL